MKRSTSKKKPTRNTEAVRVDEVRDDLLSIYCGLQHIPRRYDVDRSFATAAYFRLKAWLVRGRRSGVLRVSFDKPHPRAARPRRAAKRTTGVVVPFRRPVR